MTESYAPVAYEWGLLMVAGTVGNARLPLYAMETASLSRYERAAGRLHGGEEQQNVA